MEFHHDVGGVEEYFGQIDKDAPTITAHWQSQIDAVGHLLFKGRLISVDEFRRNIEALPKNTYAQFSYYGKWAAAILQVLLRNKTLEEKEVSDLFFGECDTQKRFKEGQEVWVKQFETRGIFRRPHLRTPGFVHGKKGVIERYAGSFLSPHVVAWNFDFNQNHEKVPLYRVRFRMQDVWEHSEFPNDSIEVEVFQQWLTDKPIEMKNFLVQPEERSHEHEHDEDEDEHVHDSRANTDKVALERETFNISVEEAKIAEVLIDLLVKKKILSMEQILETERMRDKCVTRGPMIVAKAWKDEEFKRKLLKDGRAALKEIGIDCEAHLVVHEQTEKVWNLVVCTLCSCYPTAILGRPPTWYKSVTYRSRAPIEPRKVLKEFGVNISDDVEVR